MDGQCSTDLYKEHPLFLKLRNGMLWHCTSVPELRLIQNEGVIKPSDGLQRWGRHACQQLGAVPLFDFTAPEVDVIFADHMQMKWPQFLGCASPITVVLGLERHRLPGELIFYPKNKEGTTGNVIPWVEVCHRGPVPVSTIAQYLFVCCIDYSQFQVCENFDESILARAQEEFAVIVGEHKKRRDARLAEPPDTLEKQVARKLSRDKAE